MSEKNNEHLEEKVNETTEELNEATEEVTEAPVDDTPIDVDGDGAENRVAELEKELEAAEEKYLRLYAEFENYKKRLNAELQLERTYKSQGVLKDIIPALDNIERALQQQGEDAQFQSLHKGVEMSYESLMHALKSHGLEEIKAEGEPFDPNFHQAVMQDQDESKEVGIILEELQKGYKLKDRVLRASMVKVNE